MRSHSYISNCTTLIQIYYYRPDFTNIIQEFSWQYNDFNPVFPRTHKFLDFWHSDIDAVIQEILMTHSESPHSYQFLDGEFRLK